MKRQRFNIILTCSYSNTLPQSSASNSWDPCTLDQQSLYLYSAVLPALVPPPLRCSLRSPWRRPARCWARELAGCHRSPGGCQWYGLIGSVWCLRGRCLACTWWRTCLQIKSGYNVEVEKIVNSSYFDIYECWWNFGKYQIKNYDIKGSRFRCGKF